MNESAIQPLKEIRSIILLGFTLQPKTSQPTANPLLARRLNQIWREAAMDYLNVALSGEYWKTFRPRHPKSECFFEQEKSVKLISHRETYCQEFAKRDAF